MQTNYDKQKNKHISNKKKNNKNNKMKLNEYINIKNMGSIVGVLIIYLVKIILAILA